MPAEKTNPGPRVIDPTDVARKSDEQERALSATSVPTELLPRPVVEGDVGLGFRSQFTLVNGIRLHFVEGGANEHAVVLIPGWPQTWYAWRRVMPTLAKTYRVVAVDIRGMGESSRPESGYDAAALADDISALMDQLSVTHYSVIGHDVGMWIAYALGSKDGARIDKLVVSESFIPGVSPTPPLIESSERNAGLFQFVFNQLPNLPEFLVAGREDGFIRWMVGHRAYWPDRVAVGEYTRAYSAPGAMKSGFEYYRALPQTMHQNQEFSKTKLQMRVLAIGGKLGAGQITIDAMRLVSDNVTGKVLERCGHYTPEECPAEFLGEVMRFLAE